MALNLGKLNNFCLFYLKYMYEILFIIFSDRFSHKIIFQCCLIVTINNINMIPNQRSSAILDLRIKERIEILKSIVYVQTISAIRLQIFPCLWESRVAVKLLLDIAFILDVARETIRPGRTYRRKRRVFLWWLRCSLFHIPK